MQFKGVFHSVAQTTGAAFLIGGADSGFNFMIGDCFQVPFAKGGNDLLISGPRTHDDMWGDGPFMVAGGNDVFVFGSRNGDDVIWDFHHGQDAIALIGFGAPGNRFDHLNIDVVDGNSVIHLGGDNSVTIMGVTNLLASDFLFHL
jgi:serralysin